MSLHRTVEYLTSVSHYPLAVIIDSEGREWTWAEGRSGAVAIRGVLPGLPNAAVRWDNPRSWRAAMRVAFAAQRRRASRVYAHARLLDWAGRPWTAPVDPCVHCAGTGHRLGTATSMTRPGAVRDGVLVDRNLLGRWLLPFELNPAIIVDALKAKTSDIIRIRSVGNETRAVVARLRGSTEDMDTFEDVDAALPGSLALDGPKGVLAPEPAPTPRQAPPGRRWLDSPDDDRGRRPSARRTSKTCPNCGGLAAGGACERCGPCPS